MGDFEPGLGHAVFGNTWESCNLPESQVAMLTELGEAIERIHGADPMSNSGARWTVPGLFTANAYDWSGCSRACGFEAAEADWEEAHPHSEECFLTRLDGFESEMETEGGFARYSNQGQEAILTWVAEHGGPARGYGVHCDCGVHEDYTAWLEGRGHIPSCGVVRPNFEHFPSGLRVSWYKYSGRETSTNLELADREFRAIIDECISRVSEGRDGYENDEE